ncbi:hypothetical protein EVAR_49750_1 [Eumeta japonica]|uniref:Uncharacterized protein n=1 Tax=Eumeta variegata TaxID=151549 RepID=A0A4C1YBX1_EUMVA|nr:hypothetical protein EVAR_49750_1 [Eumeta japonica]
MRYIQMTYPRCMVISRDWEDDVMLALYADDSTYFASSRRADLAAKRIQRVLDQLPEWLDKWRMAVNVSKTAALLTGAKETCPINCA